MSAFFPGEAEDPIGWEACGRFPHRHEWPLVAHWRSIHCARCSSSDRRISWNSFSVRNFQKPSGGKETIRMRLRLAMASSALLALVGIWFLSRRSAPGVQKLPPSASSIVGSESELEARLAAVAMRKSGGPRSHDFNVALEALLDAAAAQDLTHVDVSAGELHRLVGGYPGPNHRMPTCCSVMRARLRVGDAVMKEPARGAGASLTLRYQLGQIRAT